MARLRAALLAVGLALMAVAEPQAAQSPRDLKWAQLVPPQAVKKPKELKPFFGQRDDAADTQSLADDAPPPAYIPEGKWMSRARKQRGGPPALVTEFDGQRVRIGGYVVPLDFEATSVTEFLLVPFVGACIHVPPPPANQIIYVKTTEGFKVTDLFDPVYVTGKMEAKIASTGLAEAGYTIDADSVVMRTE